MPQCSEIAAMLSDYLDRDLPPDTCTAIAAHLAGCRNCNEAAEALRATVDMCRSYRAEDKPGPLSGDKHREMREALERVLASMRTGGE